MITIIAISALSFAPQGRRSVGSLKIGGRALNMGDLDGAEGVCREAGVEVVAGSGEVAPSVRFVAS